VTIQLCFLWIKLIKLTPSGIQLTPDMTPVPFATLGAHLLMQMAMSSNKLCQNLAPNSTQRGDSRPCKAVLKITQTKGESIMEKIHRKDNKPAFSKNVQNGS